MKVKHLILSMVAAAFLTSAMSVDNTLQTGMTAPKIETNQGDDLLAQNVDNPKTIIVSFWSVKHPSSRILNKEIYYTYGADKDVEVINICTDENEVLMKEVKKVDGLQDVTTFSRKDISARVFKDYGVEESSKSFKISPQGKIVEII